MFLKNNKEKDIKIAIKKIIIITVWLCIWQIVSTLTGLDFLLPGPVNVIYAFLQLLITKKFYQIVAGSFFKILIGFFTAFVSGIIMGVLAGRFRIIKDFLEPLVQAMKTVPVTAFIILILIWCGSKNVSVIITFIVTFPMIYIAIVTGIINTDTKLIEMASVFHLDKWKKIKYIYSPQVYPYLYGNLKLSLGMCWKAGISAEVIGLSGNSIGAQMYYSKLYLMTTDLFAWSITVIFVSFIFEKIFLFILEMVKNKLESSSKII